MKIKAVLPPSVSLDDFIMPESEAVNFSFDNQSRQLVWFVGDLPAGAGITGASKQLTLQFSGVLNGAIASQVIISGEDVVTGAAIQTFVSAPVAN